MITGLILALLAVLAAIMVEAYKSKMRRANPYARPQPQEMDMAKNSHNPMAFPGNVEGHVPEPSKKDTMVRAAPPEHSRNDRNRKGDVALTQAIAFLTGASLKPWSWDSRLPEALVNEAMARAHERQAEAWSRQLTMLGTDISSAMLLPATVSTGNPSLGTTEYVVAFGRAHITCDTDEEMAELQRALTSSALAITRKYVLERAEELAARATRSEVTDMPVWTFLRVNGSSSMSFRSEEEAVAVVGALNEAYYEHTKPIRDRLAQTVADLARKAKDWA